MNRQESSATFGSDSLNALMRYGIVSDIHGNREAFEEVVSALKKEAVDRYVCGGDIVGYGADPSACIKMVQELKPLVVGGNHDFAACGLFDEARFNKAARSAILWTREVLSKEEKAYLGSQSLVRQEGAFTLVHGSLDEPGNFNYIFSAREAYATIDRLETQICFVGHSHVAGAFCLDEHKLFYATKVSFSIEQGMKYIVNVGSVGQPRDGDNRASCAWYDDRERTVTIMRVPYDIEKAKKKILDARLPPVLAHRLLEGK